MATNWRHNHGIETVEMFASLAAGLPFLILLCGTTDGTRAPSIPWSTYSNGQVVGPSTVSCDVIVGGTCYKFGAFYVCALPSTGSV